eukprot:365418-Chlamydomonas_euryale.AAC.7
MFVRIQRVVALAESGLPATSCSHDSKQPQDKAQGGRASARREAHHGPVLGQELHHLQRGGRHHVQAWQDTAGGVPVDIAPRVWEGAGLPQAEQGAGGSGEEYVRELRAHADRADGECDAHVRVLLSSGLASALLSAACRVEVEAASFACV